MFSLNATVPLFLMMVLGFFLHNKTTLLPDRFADYLNTFVFKLALPVSIFQSLAESDFYAVWDTKLVLFAFVSTLLSIFIVLGVSFFLRQKALRAEFAQAGYRSSQALLGSAIMNNLYGTTGPLAIILIGAVPLYNVAAVSLLTIMTPGAKFNKKIIAKTLRGIVTNPIIIGVVAGLLWSLLHIPMPSILQKSVSSFSATASPMGLIALGASIDLTRAKACVAPSALCSAFKLVIFVAIFLPVAVWLGCRGEMLVVMLVMLGSPTTVSCFSMARSMGHEGVLSSSVVMITTVFSAFTLTGWIYLLRCLALI